MNDEPLMAAYEELRTLLSDPRCPEGVKLACLGLSNVQTKLFCAVSDSYRTEDGTKFVEHTGTLHSVCALSHPISFANSSPHSGH
jgi:hypothetical protein